MNNVVFTSCENGDDIIISLSCEEGSKFGIDGFTIIRTPKYEFTLKPDERGASINWEEDDIVVLLDEVIIYRNELKIKTRGKVQHHDFNIKNISDDEYRDLLKHFKLMNFDNSFKTIKND
jgi:hypothetical protein